MVTGQYGSLLENLSKSKYGSLAEISHSWTRADDNEVGIVRVVEVGMH